MSSGVKPSAPRTVSTTQPAAASWFARNPRSPGSSSITRMRAFESSDTALSSSLQSQRARHFRGRGGEALGGVRVDQLLLAEREQMLIEGLGAQILAAPGQEARNFH